MVDYMISKIIYLLIFQGWTQWILVLENLLNVTWSGVGLR